ncbi:hypothetical protein PIB30_024046 [Stylosanthes scabra]|uniref:Uncharacterized protein n=1 Tax=Stylosanthes scabra TaxID=79078 RepID=A0ABU6R9V0_9FABA|nr:hypothetical protein [Stylosanthes scabra]
MHSKYVVPTYSYHRLIRDVDEDDTVTDPPDVREQVTLLNNNSQRGIVRGWPKWRPCVTRKCGLWRPLSSPSRHRSHAFPTAAATTASGLIPEFPAAAKPSHQPLTT